MFKRTAALKVNKKGRKSAIAAMLAAEMALAPVLGAFTPTTALAAFEVPTKTATFTVRNVAKANETTYIAYRLFDASISSAEVEVGKKEDGTPITEWEDVGSYITWDTQLGGKDDTNTKREVILTYLDTMGYPKWLAAQGISGAPDNIDSDTRNDPANAAGFIAFMITNRNGSLTGNNHASDTDTEQKVDDLTSDGIDDYVWKDNKYQKHYVENKSKDKSDNDYVRKIWARNGASFALGLAQKLQGIDGLTPLKETAAETGDGWRKTFSQEGKPDEWTLTGDDGYYLVMTAKGDGVIDASEAGTAPIWVALGGQTSEMTEKAIVGIQFDKDVAEDRNIGKTAADTAHNNVVWGKTADANTGQDLWYRLYGTLPTNLKSFKTYHYQFTDVLPKGTELTGTTANVRVVLYNPTYAGDNDNGKTITKAAKEFLAEHVDRTDFVKGTGEKELSDNMVDITGLATITYADGTEANAGHKVLTVNIEDLLKNLGATESSAGNPTNVSGDSIVAVYYQAHLTNASDVVYGLDGASGTDKVGNQNKSKLTYSADPITMVDKDVAGDPKTTQTYSYQLEVTKRDKVNGKPLQGAKYTIQVADYDEGKTPISGGKTAKEVSVDPNTDIDSANKFVSKNGELVGARPTTKLENEGDGAFADRQTAWDNNTVFTTDENGQFTVKGLDEGVYIIREVEAPKGTSAYVYKVQDDDMVLTVESTLPADPTDGDQVLQEFKASVSGGESKGGLGGQMYSRLGTYDMANRIHTTIEGITEYKKADPSAESKSWVTTSKDAADATTYYAPTIGDGKIQLLTADDRSVVLPITGMTGPQAAIIAGAALIIVSGVGAFVVKRRRNSVR